MTIGDAIVTFVFLVFVAWVMNPKNIDVWFEIFLYLLTLAVVFIVLS